MHTYRHSLVRQPAHLHYVVDKSEHCFATIAIGSDVRSKFGTGAFMALSIKLSGR